MNVTKFDILGILNFEYRDLYYYTNNHLFLYLQTTMRVSITY